MGEPGMCRSRLSDAERRTEAARKPGGEENALYELLAAQLLERSISLKAVCECCSFEWEPGGLSDPLAVPLTADGSLCAKASDYEKAGSSVPRALLLSCPECAEDARPAAP
jgi:hypothetical protein